MLSLRVSRVLKLNPFCRILLVKNFCSKKGDENESIVGLSLRRNTHLNDRYLYINKYNSIDANIYSLCRSVIDGRLSVRQLEEDPEFARISQSLINQINSIPNSNLIRMLQSLLIMGMKPTDQLVRYMENEILWRCRDLPFKSLLKCLSYHTRFQETQQQKQVVTELIINIQSKLDEVRDEDIIQLIRLSKSLSDECVSRIEESALQIITQNIKGQFNFDSLCYLLVLLAQSKRRPTPLIRAAVNNLIETPTEEVICPPAHIINMISALNSLNYPDENLLRKCSDILCNNDFLSKVPSSAKRNLLVAVSQLNYCYPRLMDAFIEKLTDDQSSFVHQDLITFVLTSARLYYQTPYTPEFLSAYILPNIKQNSMDESSWLNFIWSLAILGNVTEDQFSSLLNKEFYQRLFSNINSFEETILKLKLLNIKAVAEVEMKADFILPFGFADVDVPKRHSDLEVVRDSILESLNSFIPKGKYMDIDVKTPFGFSIDAEFIVNSSMKPLPLKDYPQNIDDLTKQTNPLPDGFKRVALLCVGYNDTLIGDRGLVGVQQLAVRILEKLNYTVIVINQNDFSIRATAIKKIQHLQKVISHCIKA